MVNRPADFEIVDSEFDWLKPHCEESTRALAAIMILMDMLPFEKRDNAHKRRLWARYMENFSGLVAATIDKLNDAAQVARVTTFYEGDVLDHFKRFTDDPDAIFYCYAPTYAGGYERLYKRLDQIVKWTAPSYEMLDESRRDKLLGWMSERRFLWYDDRTIEGLDLIMQQRSGRNKTVYLYSNVIKKPAYFNDRAVSEMPNFPLAGADFEITDQSAAYLAQINTSDLLKLKDAFLGKNINFAAGMWAFAVVVDGCYVGFLEFKNHYTREAVYMMADFAVPGTRYKRLSKLVVMLAKAGQTKKAIERLKEHRVKWFSTTAFTNRPASMKYRGILNLTKRGETKDGQKFLQYESEFNNLSWQEAFSEWISKHSKHCNS